MEKNRLSKIFKVITTATLISVLTAGTVFAADQDIYNNDGTSFVERSSYLDQWDKVKEAVLNQESFSYEFDGRIFDLSTIAQRTANLSEPAFTAALTAVSQDASVPSKSVEEFTGEQQGDLVVASVSAINSINVEFQTVVDALVLPAQATVLVNGEEQQVDVTWDTSNYDGNTAGTYALVGALTLPEGIINPDGLTATVNVVVAEEVITDLTAYEATLAAVVEADYTVESWTAYQVVVAANVVTAENTQEEVTAATDLIVSAQADLVTLEEVAVAAVNEAANYLTLQAALEAPELGLVLGGYADFTDTNKEVVATAVLAARPAGGFADLAAIQTAFDAEVSGIVVGAFDAALLAVNGAADGAALEAVLTTANLAALDLKGLVAEYSDLDPAQTTTVAAAVVVVRDALVEGAEGRNTDAIDDVFFDKAELEAAFEDATAMPAAALAELNAATDADGVLAAFKFESLGLVFPAEYEAMSEVSKTAVATDVLGGVSFANVGAAQVALEDAVLAEIAANEGSAAAEAAMLAVNEATKAVDMRLALESTDFATATPSTTIAAKNYTSEEKTWLVEEVIIARDALEDYADDTPRNAEAVAGVIYDETELTSIVGDAITAIDARIAAITTAETSLVAISTPVEAYQINDTRDGIDVDDADTDLSTEVTTARTDVDAAVAAGAVEADLEGIEVLIEAEAKVEELEAEIAVIAAVNAVNAADGDSTAIRVALAAEELGLDAYNALSLTDKNAVAAAIDLAIDDNEFYDLAELEAAVSEAIASL